MQYEIITVKVGFWDIGSKWERNQGSFLFISVKRRLSSICCWFMSSLIRIFFLKQVSKCLRGEDKGDKLEFIDLYLGQGHCLLHDEFMIQPAHKRASFCFDSLWKNSVFFPAKSFQLKLNDLEKIQKNLHQFF